MLLRLDCFLFVLGMSPFKSWNLDWNAKIMCDFSVVNINRRLFYFTLLALAIDE